MAGLSSPGIGSNLDVNSIVSQLIAAERQPLQTMLKKETVLQAQLSAIGNIKGAVATFQSAMTGVANASRFNALNVKTGDATVFTASASSAAVAGNYAIKVTQLAANQSISSSAFTNTTDLVGTGTLTFQFGTYDSGGNSFTLNSAKAAQTVTIDSANNSLGGIRDAVNNAKIGVTATIVNDGTGNRLVFTSDDSGAANSLKLSVSDGDATHTDTSGLSRLAYDPTATAGAGKNLTENQAAQNAKIKVNGIDIEKSTNTISDAIEGVTLNLLKESPSTAVSLAVSRDTTSATSAVKELVDAYNALNKVLVDLTKYDASTKQSGLLNGDATLRAMQTSLRQALGSTLGVPSGSLSRLSQVGVSFQVDGTLKLDTTKLNAVLSSNPSELAGLFSTTGRSTDSLVKFDSSTSATTAGNYAVNITQMATRGSRVGQAAANLTITAGVNDQLAFKVDGNDTTVSLAAGTYASTAALAAEVQSKINGALSATGAAVSVSQSGDVITLSSNRYGSSSKIELLSGGGNGASDLFGGGSTATDGVDVAGTINGFTATGSGQYLSGSTGTTVEGLRLLVLGGGTGDRGTVTVNQGFGYQLGKLAESFLAKDGPLSSRTDGLNARIKLSQKQQSAFNDRMISLEKRYRAQFTALDQMIGRMNQTSNYLTQQLANLPGAGS